MQTAGFNQAILGLRKLAKRHKPMVNLVVGYGADYSTWVHENTQVAHPNGQSKFLETPARALSVQLATMVRQEIGNGKTMEEALKAAGDFLLAESKKLVPVRTGFLRDSGFVDVR